MAMRSLSPRAGERRIREWFAVLPVAVPGEMRWFEYVRVEEEFMNAGPEGWMWNPIRFVNRICPLEEP